MTIVFDASVLIAYLDGADAHHSRAVSLLEREVDEDFAASPLTIAEVLVGPTRAGRMGDAVAALQDLEVAEMAFPEETAVQLVQLRAATGLRMPDCCVLLAARNAGAAVAAFDEALAGAAAGLGLRAVTS